MRPAKVKTTLRAYIAANIPAFLWGAPGVFKSAIVREIAADDGAVLVDWRALLHDVTDLKGLPVPDLAARLTTWLAPDDLPFVQNAARFPTDRPIYLFLDELNAAPPSMQAACFGLVLERRAGPHILLPNVRIIAAGNRREDKAAAQNMPSALANRFAHIDCTSDPDDWCEWAARNGLPPVLVAFIRWSYRPGNTAMLHVPPVGTADARAFPTPRSVASVAPFVDVPDAEIRNALIAGLVGQPWAQQFEAFRLIWSRLPPIAAILADPDGAPVPAEPGLAYAIAGALAARATLANFRAVGTYAARLPADMGAVCILDAVRRFPTLRDHPVWTEWTVRLETASHGGAI